MQSNPSVAFYTLGCKLNQAETEKISWQLVKSSYSSGDLATADICIINTCTVTHIADRKARHMLRLIRKQNPKALIIAAGCYVDRTGNELIKCGADMVVDNHGKGEIARLVMEKFACGIDGTIETQAVSGNSRIRSFIKIQDGCRHFCTYCIVPFVRTKEYSVPAEDVIAAVKEREAQGYKEVVLTGTEIGRYQDDNMDLAQLVERILEQTNMERLHLSSLQPQEISERLLGLWSDTRLSRHFHLALQSGSDTVLKRMRREYNSKDYSNAVSMIREYIPDASITTDIMVGFPGESDHEFRESINFCRDIGFAGIHVFTYSTRPGTAASMMPGQIDERIKKLRSGTMLALSRDSARNYRGKYLGKTMHVLFETEVTPGSGVYSGFTENYIRIFARSGIPLINLIVPVKLVRHYHHDAWGEVAK